MRSQAANEIEMVLNGIDLEFSESSQSRASYVSSQSATENSQSPNSAQEESQNSRHGSSQFLRENTNR